MTDLDGAEKKKQRLRFFARAAAFAVLAAVMLSYAAYVLTPKYDYGMCSIANLYRQPENSVDVLVLGTSLAYAGINTNVLWEEYGIAAYDLCSAEQPFWVSYYYLKEALKTQSPSLILIDAKPASYQQDYSTEGRAILSTAGIRSLSVRAEATLACVGWEDFPETMLRFSQVHENYAELTWDDFSVPPDNGGRGVNWKGYIEMDNTEAHERPSLVWNSSQRTINSREEEYFRRLLSLIQEEGIDVMLVGIPNADYANDHMYYNTLWSIAEEYGVEGINYNDPQLRFGLLYSSDCADWQHLNVKGSVTFTRKLGEDLRSLYELPDRRGDSAYASYDACAEQWYSVYPDVGGTESI